MVQFPNCPKCGNSSDAMSVVDIELGGVQLKAIQCNNCDHIVCCYRDYKGEIDKLKELVENLESRIDDMEN